MFIYQNNNGSWVQIGMEKLQKKKLSHSFCRWFCVASVRVLDGNGGSSGRIRIYQNNNGSWQQIGDY